MKKSKLSWISSGTVGAAAVAFYFLSGLPNPVPAIEHTETVMTISAELGTRAFKHDLYFGDDRDTLNNLAKEDLLLLAHYGG